MPAAETKTIRMSKSAHEKLSRMAQEDNLSLIDELDRLIEEKRRERMFARADAAYAETDATEREALREERDAWDATLADGVADE